MRNVLTHCWKSAAFMLGRPLTLALLRTNQMHMLRMRSSVKMGIESSGTVSGGGANLVLPSNFNLMLEPLRVLAQHQKAQVGPHDHHAQRECAVLCHRTELCWVHEDRRAPVRGALLPRAASSVEFFDALLREVNERRPPSRGALEVGLFIALVVPRALRRTVLLAAPGPALVWSADPPIFVPPRQQRCTTTTAALAAAVGLAAGLAVGLGEGLAVGLAVGLGRGQGWGRGSSVSPRAGCCCFVVDRRRRWEAVGAHHVAGIDPVVGVLLKKNARL